MHASYTNRNLIFNFPAGTSRGVLTVKPTYYLILKQHEYVGIGECSTISGLSIDPEEAYVTKLDEVCHLINSGIAPDKIQLDEFPSIEFGIETALLDLKNKGSKHLFPSDFTQGKTGIPINGLIWMGDKTFMQKQIREKTEAGFKCLKLKVGALDFETELEIIRNIRKDFAANVIELRLDANGGFSAKSALEKLKILSDFDIHSIEQPIKAGNINNMAYLCKNSPIPIVLDEELIGVKPDIKTLLLQEINPDYIILKPSLIGGFAKSDEWIKIAESQNIKWWITSALESNIGLNAISQWTFTKNTELPQGLGTGQIYKNNIHSPLEIRNAKLFYNEQNEWDLKITQD